MALSDAERKLSKLLNLDAWEEMRMQEPDSPIYKFAQHIFRLQEQLDKLSVRSQWVSVDKHRHEDEASDVSVLFTDGISVYYGAYSYERGTWYEHLYGKDREKDRVTAWQPLPSALQSEEA